ncbi:hypothetical protein CPB86DRAFT_819621 [Serendipita vermifera]|nr:hypothetical protein CPB86DRAFT_819621 [Serendipita vermifera]
MLYSSNYGPLWQLTFPAAAPSSPTATSATCRENSQQPVLDTLTQTFGRNDLQNSAVSTKPAYQQFIANVRVELSTKREMLVAQATELDDQIRILVARPKETFRENTKHKIQGLEEENIKDHNVMTLRKLPIETTSSVFTECVKVFHPRSLVQLWYNVTIKTPTLWNRHMITNDTEGY